VPSARRTVPSGYSSCPVAKGPQGGPCHPEGNAICNEMHSTIGNKDRALNGIEYALKFESAKKDKNGGKIGLEPFEATGLQKKEVGVHDSPVGTGDRILPRGCV